MTELLSRGIVVMGDTYVQNTEQSLMDSFYTRKYKIMQIINQSINQILLFDFKHVTAFFDCDFDLPNSECKQT